MIVTDNQTRNTEMRPEHFLQWIMNLQAFPEKQVKGILSSLDGTMTCCLGEYCQIRDFPWTGQDGSVNRLYFGKADILAGQASVEVGSNNGHFHQLQIPQINGFAGLAEANDNGVSWSVIAKHLADWYPYQGRELQVYPSHIFYEGEEGYDI